MTDNVIPFRKRVRSLRFGGPGAGTAADTEWIGFLADQLFAEAGGNWASVAGVMDALRDELARRALADAARQFPDNDEPGSDDDGQQEAA